MTRLLLLLGILILATGAEAQNDPFSMVILSDPQFFWAHGARDVRGNPFKKIDGTDCNPDGGCPAIGKSCRNPVTGAFRRQGRNVLGDPYLCSPLAAADAVTESISLFGRYQSSNWTGSWDNDMWCPPGANGSTSGCISQGQIDRIRSPLGVIINGDLTNNYSTSQRQAYEQHYTTPNQRPRPGYYEWRETNPIYPGLGNHDYPETITSKGTTKKVDEDSLKAGRDAAQWMADTIENLPNLVARDLSGFVHVRNRSGRKVRFQVNGGGYTQAGPRWETKTLGAHLESVIVRFERRKTVRITSPPKPPSKRPIVRWENRWELLDSKSIEPSGISCFSVRATNVVSFPCGTQKAVGDRLGSLSYSFDIENYRFIQLQNYFGVESDMTEDSIAGPLEGGFDVISANENDWLTDQLLEANAQGKAIVLNVHDYDQGPLKEFVTQSKVDPADARIFNVVAVFAGHIHPNLGQKATWKVGEGTQFERDVPVIQSGSAYSGGMIYADFHDDYLNWAAVRAWSPNNVSQNHMGPRPQDLPELEPSGGRVYGVGAPEFVKFNFWSHVHSDELPPLMEKQGTIDIDFSGTGTNVKPVAECTDVTVVAGPGGTAAANVDNGSYDPENLADPLVPPPLTRQSPAGPYGLGQTTVTLTVLDQGNLRDSCIATVTVADSAVDSDDDGWDDSVEDAGPNGGDCNNDGTLDRTQAGVTGLPAADGSYMCLATNCTQRFVTDLDSDSLPVDRGPMGSLVQVQNPLAFELECSAATATVYYFGRTQLTGAEYRKYGPTPSNPNDHWYSLPATFGRTTIAGETVATATFSLVDGGLGDSDLSVDGRIIDPGGPAMIGGGPTEIGVSTIPTVSGWALLLMAAALGGGAIWVLRLRS